MGELRPFEASEYERRRAAVRRAMLDQGLEQLVLFNPANVTYLTGYDSAAPSSYVAALVPLDGPIAIQVPDLQTQTVRMTAPGCELLSFEWHSTAHGPADQLAEAIADRGAHEARVGVELGRPEPYSGAVCDARTYLGLRTLLPRAELVDESELVLEVRARKSPAELAAMRRAGELTAIGLRASIELVAEGVTDNELVAAAQSAMTRAGSELPCYEPICMVGRRGGWGPMAPYMRVPLGRGDPAYFEYSGVHARYNAPAMRTASVGTPSVAVRRAAEVALETLELLVAGIRAGRSAGDVALEAAPPLAKLDPEVWWHGGFGYSVGLGMQPTWTEAPLYIVEAAERELEAGMTFHLPIVLMVPGEFAVGFSETVAVTATGCEVLTGGSARGPTEGCTRDFGGELDKR